MPPQFGAVMRYPISHYTDESIQLKLNGQAELLAPVVAHLFDPTDAPEPCSYIDLCARDYSMLRALSESCCGAAYIGIDKDPANDPRELWGIEVEGEPQALPFPIGNFDERIENPEWGDALLLDVFSSKGAFEQIERLSGSSQRRVYCRPPANVPRTRFMESVEDAGRLARNIFGRDVDFYAVEWYYIAAVVKIMGAQGRAVVQIPARLLNLGKCENDRRLFVQSGLIEQVVHLPETLSQGEGMLNDALLVLSHGNHEHIKVIDARDVSPAPSPTESVLALLREYDHAKSERGTASWVPELDISDMEATSYSLAPLSHAVDEEASYATIGECFNVVRGVPRSTIVNLPDAEALRDVAPVDYYYVTANALEDGACIEFDKLPHLIKKSDTYDLGDLEAWETAGRPMGLKKLKLIDPFAPHVLIARSGAPFKVAMTSPAKREWDEEVGGHWSLWIQDSVVLPDSMICLTPIAKPSRACDKPEYFCLPEYLLAYLSTDEGQTLLRETAHGAAIPQLSVGDVRRMRIPLPSPEKQRAAAERFADRQHHYEQAITDLQKALEEKRARL